MKSLVFSWIILSMVERGVGTLLASVPATNASCSAPGDWSWMDNNDGTSPCLQAAFLMSPCVESPGVPALTGNMQYTPLVDPGASPCACTWAAYNLFAACTACQQGFQDNIPSWVPSWTQHCTSDELSSTPPYPENFSIPGDMTFPNWAAVNPTTWQDQRFDANQAESYAADHKGDFVDHGNATSTPTPTPAPTQKHNSTNVGAIAGGVIGGFVVLAIGIAAAFFLHCRHRRRSQKGEQPQAMVAQGPDHHIRSPSDLSAKTFATSFGYSPLGNRSSPSDGSLNRLLSSAGTFRTHNSSNPSFAQGSLMQTMSLAVTPPPQQGGATDQPNSIRTSNGVVSPFTLERPTSSPDTQTGGHAKKRSDVSAHAGDAGGSPPGGRSARMNPPAYSEALQEPGDFSSQAPDQGSTYGSTSIITTPMSNHSRRLHEKTPSAGTLSSNHSNSSTTSAGYWTHGQSASLSGAADIISQMATAGSSAPASTAPGYTGSGPNMTVTRDENRQPTNGN